MHARNFGKALNLLPSLPHEAMAEYCLHLAQHFAKKGDFAKAEDLFLRANQPRLAVEMYAQANRFDDIHRMAPHLDEGEVVKLYLEQADRLEKQGQRGAECCVFGALSALSCADV